MAVESALQVMAVVLQRNSDSSTSCVPGGTLHRNLRCVAVLQWHVVYGLKCVV